MAFGYQHVQSEIDSEDVLFAMPMRDLYVMFNDGDPHGSIFIDKNVCEAPLQKITAFLGIPFQSSSNAISGGDIDDLQFVAIKERLLAQFARSCTENGQGYLPVPVSTRSKMHISAATYVWLGFLCLHGMESWSTCKSGANILCTINQVGRGPSQSVVGKVTWRNSTKRIRHCMTCPLNIWAPWAVNSGPRRKKRAKVWDCRKIDKPRKKLRNL